MLDVSLFGIKPLGHHLVNLALHICNTLLLFALWNRMTRALWSSAMVAALFAVHPLHVESVAWVADEGYVEHVLRAAHPVGLPALLSAAEHRQVLARVRCLRWACWPSRCW